MSANAKTELTPSDQVTLPANSKLVATTTMSFITRKQQKNLNDFNHFKFITPEIEITKKTRSGTKTTIKENTLFVEVSTVYTLPKDFEFTDNGVVYKTAADMEVTLPDGSYTVEATNCSLFNCLENKQENFSVKESTDANAVSANKVIEALEIFEMKGNGKYVLTLNNGEYTIDASCLETVPFRLFKIDGDKYASDKKDNFEFLPQNAFLVDKSDTDGKGTAVEKAMLSIKGTFLFSTVEDIQEGIGKNFSSPIRRNLDMTNNAEVKVTPSKNTAITTVIKTSEPDTTGEPDKNKPDTRDANKGATNIPEPEKKTGTEGTSESGKTQTQTTDTTAEGEKTDAEEESTSQGMSGTTITIIVVVVVIVVLAACIGLFYYYKCHVLKKNPVELGKEEDTEI